MTQHTVWQTFTSAPHRVFFFAGAIQGVLAMAWWLFDLTARYTGLFTYTAWSIPAIWAHAFLMLYGFFPFFIFGFLMTAAPNWVNGRKISRSHYIPASMMMIAGVVAFYPALTIGRWLAAVAVALHLIGWMIGGVALLGEVANSSSDDKRHAYIVVGNLWVGWVGAGAYLLWLLSGSPSWLHFAVTGGIWLFLLPIFVSVSHRMIPFFSSTVLPNYEPRRPYWPLFALLGGMVLHAMLDLSNAPRLLWLVDLPMMAVALYLSVLWKFDRSFKVRLLAMLHVGFAWLWIALALYAAQSFFQFVGWGHILGLAPLHALTIGYFTSMVLAMVTRVTLGHSGRLLSADKTVWRLFLGFQFTVLFRILGDLPFAYATNLYFLAALIWLVCFAIWDIKYVPIYLQPRKDGKMG